MRDKISLYPYTILDSDKDKKAYMEYKYSLNELLTILPLLKMIFPKNHDLKCLNKEGLEILRSHFNALFDSDETRTEI